MGVFSKGDRVIHCRDGLAIVVDDTIIAGNEYFVVKTVRGGGENIYVPIDRAAAIIRPLMTQKEADELINSIKNIQPEYNNNTKQRRDSLKRRLMSGSVNDIAFLFKQLYLYKTANDPGIKYGPVDLDMLQYAADNLLDELAISYDVPRDEIEVFVYNKLSM